MDSQISINKNFSDMYAVDKDYPLEVNTPNNIMIEVTNVCNLKCKMCYNQHMKRKKGFMSFDLFKSIVNQASELGIENMGLYTTGESFLHPLIFEFIAYTKYKGIKYVYITTNGQILNDEKIEKIFESGLDSIKFSIDAGTKEKYESLKNGASWDRLIEIIKKIRKNRDEKNAKLKIFSSFIIMENNYTDFVKYNNVFNNLIDESILSLIVNHGSQIHHNFYSKNVNSIIQNYILPREKWQPCNFLWNRFIVTHEGYLTICCVDFENKLVYGDLNKESLKSCWNNKKIKRNRKIHKRRQFEKLPLCFDCDAIKQDYSSEHELFTKLLQI